jgi:hypothetical protein
MKVPSLKDVYEWALRRSTEDIALKRPHDVVGYDQKLDDLFDDEDEEENKTSNDMMIRRIA